MYQGWRSGPIGLLRSPKRLEELCLLVLIRKFESRVVKEKLGWFSLPEELTTKVVELLSKRRKLSDESLSTFLNSRLERLDLTNCQTVNVSLVTEKCWNLRNLCLRGCLTVSDQTLNHIATNCSNLTALSLTYNKKITDNGIARLTAVCTGLQELDLSWCSRVSDSSLESIALHCPDLRELLVACCKLIRGTGIPHLAKHCGRLSHLVLRGCSNVEHLHLLSTSLTDLNLGNCLSLKEEVLATEIRCPSMVSLSLASVTTATDAAVESLLKANASVSKLELNFTNVVQPKMEGCSLRVLDLSSCQLLSLGMFQNLALHCTQLGELYLRGCKSVNDECVDHLTRAPQLGSGGGSSAPTGYRSNLRKIDLSRCESITDKAVSFIAARCSSLEYLDVSWCTRLTDASLRHLGQAATRFCCLEHVKIFGCTSMSSQAIQSLQHISSLHLHCIMNDKDWSTLEAI